MSQVTSFEFSYYDAARYTLDEGREIRMSDINRSLLMLYNNDLWLYTKIDGAYKGLWWRKWYDGVHTDGYAAGDMIAANGIDDLSFLRQNWTYVKRIWDRSGEANALPDFRSADISVVMLYKDALFRNFSLGSAASDRQLFISLRDDNRAPADQQDAWAPYLLTRDELEDRSVPMAELFKLAIGGHELEWHAPCLDEMDERDREFESGPRDPMFWGTSIYEGLLLQYLPKDALPYEHPDWIEFVRSARGEDGRRWEEAAAVLGLGATAHDFLHVVKPLGDDEHAVEAWIRSDGHVRIHGRIGVEETDGNSSRGKNVEVRLDFPLNDESSKLYLLSNVETVPGWICPIDCAIADKMREAKYETSVDLAVLSDMSRLFGTAKAPRIAVVTKTLSSPGEPGVIGPFSVVPTVDVRVNDTPYGQTAVFSVPDGCEELEFTVEGMAQSDFIEDCRPEFFDTRENETDRLKWQGVVIDWRNKRDKARIYEEFGVIVSGFPLIDSAGGMFDRLNSLFIENSFFGAHFLARNVPVEPLRLLVDAVGISFDPSEEQDETLGAAIDIVSEGYEALYKAVEWKFLYSGWYNRYMFKTAEEYGSCAQCTFIRQRLIKALHDTALGKFPDGIPAVAARTRAFASEIAEEKPVTCETVSALADELEKFGEELEEMKTGIENGYVNEGMDSTPKVDVGEIAREESRRPFYADCEAIANYAYRMSEWLKSSMEKLRQVEETIDGPVSEDREENLMELRDYLKDGIYRTAKIAKEVSTGYRHYLESESGMLGCETATMTAMNMLGALSDVVSSILDEEG